MICSRYRSSTASVSGEAGLDSIQTFHQLVDFAKRIVQVERGARAGGAAATLRRAGGGVHASTLGGTRLGTNPRSSTRLIMSRPPRKGGIAASSASRAKRT